MSDLRIRTPANKKKQNNYNFFHDWYKIKLSIIIIFNGYLPIVLTAVEIISVFFNLLYIYFAIRQLSIAWIFGVIAALLSIYLFYMTDYFGSALLNLVYAIQGLFGFFQWQYYLKNKMPEFKLSLKSHIVLISAILCIFLVISLFFSKNSQLTQIDILLSLGSILATFLEIRKDISCWYYWIVLNICFTILYSLQQLYLYGALMLVLGIFSFFALKEWQKAKIATV
jgi:nicotinamide mononucleotide transporter